ncbi:exodeoxyribonuclease VII small subunit [Bifidobacterium bombi]|uniref:Exodeoxyribonuclease VII small subunit n=1 Tax=Bifidobacterium bombi DSM 19703 TaxID=1341695 RepID=A0A080N5S4_9BIFI|nr:exodeoxyribonuclease VII small subunit [Bifidobacterium bombi]KFF30954.1 exodeoxyribonuclease VII, small subunit [Bifidobacterium bombi DSM 19703]
MSTNDNRDETATPASSLTDKEREEIASLPYEEARDRLIKTVQALEAGGLNLDQSMRQWEIGEALANRAQSLLTDVRAKLEKAQSVQESTAATAGTQTNLE